MLYLINPSLVCHRGDGHSSGIPYLPHGLAYLSAILEQSGLFHEVIDAFGEAPNQAHACGPYVTLGLAPEKIRDRVSSKRCEGIILYANSVFNSRALLEIARGLGRRSKPFPILVVENTQAVTGFSLLRCGEEILKSPITHIILGESEAIAPSLISSVLQGGPIPDALLPHVWRPGEPTATKKNIFVSDLDTLPWPAWRRFPLENYWRLGYGHGPVSGKYLALLTSRGCPYPCGFCSVPVMNHQKWRMRSAGNVVDEMEYFFRAMAITEFHWEDLNPTIHENRMVEIADEILRRKLTLRWKIVSGTKMDNLKMETLEKMAASGLDYISFSPESGSPEVLKKIRKPFQHRHALQQVRRLRRLGVKTQACFVLGYPGEQEKDRKSTSKYSKELLRAGVSELTYFIVAPMPGTPIEGKVQGHFEHLSDLTFSPSWREDYQKLVGWRDRLYVQFFIFKICSRPLDFILSCLRALAGSYRLKMEMFPRRKLKMLYWEWRAGRKTPPLIVENRYPTIEKAA